MKKPQYMIIYDCPHCGQDSGRTELNLPPTCFYCDASEGLIERSRQLLSPEVMSQRLKTVTDRMVQNLQQAWDIHESEWPDDPEQEILLLEALAKGQDLRTAIQSLRMQTTNADEPLSK